MSQFNSSFIANHIRVLLESIQHSILHDEADPLTPIQLFHELKTLVNPIRSLSLSRFIHQLEITFQVEIIRANTTYKNNFKKRSEILPFFIACCHHITSLIQSSPTPITQGDQTDLDNGRKRVIIIDDSLAFQALLSKILQSNPKLEVVGVASNTHEAEKMIESLRPDIITLDLHMPEMDGFVFLDHLKSKHPIPVVLISEISSEGGKKVFNALYQGAINFIPKSQISLADSKKMSETIFNGARCSLRSLMRFYKDPSPTQTSLKLDLTKILAIGAGIGSTRTLIDLLSRLPKNIPPTVVVQNIIPKFSKILIQELHEICSFVVKEAEDGEILEPSKVLISPTGTQMFIEPCSEGLRVRLVNGNHVHGQKPSIDVLFDSVSICSGEKAVGILLSGVELDGAQGLREIRNAGGLTIVHDEMETLFSTGIEEAVRLDACSFSSWGECLSETTSQTLLDHTQQENKSVASTTSVVEGSGSKILIVDDSPVIRSILKYNLKALGFSYFHEAKDGLEAWNMLITACSNNQPFELIISDHIMPELNGHELLKKIRSHEKLKSTPFILATSTADKKSILDAVESGVTGYILKPVSTKILISKVISVLKTRR